jgi:hypothetical protein
MQSGLVSPSKIDEERFGIKTAKAFLLRVDNIPDVMKYCQMNEVEFLIVRSYTSDLPAAQQMERLGFLHMDTLIYYSYNLKGRVLPDDVSDIRIRPVRSGEEDAVRSVAREIFVGYAGHYYADSRLDKKKCDEIYSDWAYRCCVSSEVADGVLLAVHGEKIIGFGTMRINNQAEGEGLLFGVIPSLHGRKVHRSVMIGCLNWCAQKGLERMIISTQITNLASQKVWIRLGFEPRQSFYIFHKWFSSSGAKVE